MKGSKIFFLKLFYYCFIILKPAGLKEASIDDFLIFVNDHTNTDSKLGGE